VRFGLLGIDPPMAELALAVAASPDHQLVWLWGSDPALHSLMAAAPSAQLASAWEDLLALDTVDAVLAGAVGSEEDRLERLRHLAQAAIPTVVSHPFCSSMLPYYELDMICQQSGGILVPYVPARWHPLWSDLSALTAEAPEAHAWELLAIERHASALSRVQVLEGLIRDLELARGLAGDLLRVTAMAGPDERGLATLSVTAAGSRMMVRWSAVPGERSRGAHALLSGPLGECRIDMPDDGTAWRLAGRLAQQSVDLAYPHWRAGEASLPHLARALARQPGRPSWLDAARGMELADAVERSLERGRTIAMHYGEHNEAETFKAVMSGGGCLMLVLAMAIFVLAPFARALGLRLADYWPYALLALLALFLLAQTLRLAFPPGGEDSSPATHQPPHPRGE